jgi:hypothetical protein
MTGRFFAASPRSANHTSPGSGVIEQVQDLFFYGAWASQIQNILVGEVYDFGDSLACLRCHLRLPLAQSRVQLSAKASTRASFFILQF